MVTTFTEETDPFCLAALDAAALLFDAPWRRYAVIGDSLSAGTGDKSAGYGDQGWSDRVAHILRQVRPGLAYLNTAVDGATTVDTLAHQADRMRRFAPDLLHLPAAPTISCAAHRISGRSSGTCAPCTTWRPPPAPG
ncbi:SGNH/GDSL hydrolase family protein [Streptomyces nogalater]